MKLLVTGGSGYVGAEILRRAPKNFQLAATYWGNPIANPSVAAFCLDLRDHAAVARVVHDFQPEAIIHTAAQVHGDAMIAINADGARHIARAARKAGARLIHLSSDVIFDGEHAPYSEDAAPHPITPYAESKARAESAVKEVFSVIASTFASLSVNSAKQSPSRIWRLLRRRSFASLRTPPRNDVANFVIVRTSLVYGFAPLDPRTRQTLAGEMPRLFTDEFRCPIFVSDLADALIELAQNAFVGTLNVAGAQRVSRYDFGLRLARASGIAPRFAPALSATSPAPRPRDCALDMTRAQEILRTKLRGVDQVLAELFPLPS